MTQCSTRIISFLNLASCLKTKNNASWLAGKLPGGIKRDSKRTATGLNGVLCVSWVEGGRRASLRRLLEKAMEWEAMVSCGAYKRRAATNSGWISI